MPDELDPVRDRVVAVTGAGTGIGREVAVKFGELGWRVAIGGRRVDKLRETADAVDAAGGTCLPHALDVADGDSVETFFATVEASFGTVTALINNAAAARTGPLDDFSPEEIASEVNIKLTGSLLMARRGIHAMRRDGRGGDILFMTSMAASMPWPYHLPYAAANAGLEHAARTLRLELEGSGIRVQTLRCGETGGTDFFTKELESGRAVPANEHFFRYALVRHAGLMTPPMVADAVVTAVTLPRDRQFGLLEVTPTAPMGELPNSFDDWIAAVTARFVEQQP